MELRLNPSVSGAAQVRLFRGDRTDGDMAQLPTSANVVFSEDIPVIAGNLVTRTFTRAFPGGDQYYWLFVGIWDMSGSFIEAIYTTPIFISSTP